MHKKYRFLFMKYLNPILANPYVLLLPAIVICFVFSIIPVILVLISSFFNIDFVAGTQKFIGINNYKAIFADAGFLLTLKNTAIFTVATVFIGVSLALLVAVFLNRNNVVYNTVQSIVFTPHIISYVSIAVLWMFLMDPKFGVINYVLSWFGIPPLKWMISTETSLLSIVIVSIWKGLGYNTMILLAGLQNVPRDIYEAARIDKSNPIRTFFSVTIPMISPTLIFLITTSIISSFSAFDIVNLMTKGGPKNSSNLMVHWIYENGFLYYKVGNAMAAGVVLMLLVGGITVVNFRLMNKKVHY